MSGEAPADPITIRVNGREREVSGGTSILDLLGELGLRPGLVVVERNREILSRDGLDGVELAGGDVIEIVHFVGGG